MPSHRYLAVRRGEAEGVLGRHPARGGLVLKRSRAGSQEPPPPFTGLVAVRDYRAFFPSTRPPSRKEAAEDEAITFAKNRTRAPGRQRAVRRPRFPHGLQDRVVGPKVRDRDDYPAAAERTAEAARRPGHLSTRPSRSGTARYPARRTPSWARRQGCGRAPQGSRKVMERIRRSIYSASELPCWSS